MCLHMYTLVHIMTMPYYNMLFCVIKAYFRRGEVHRALVEQPLALSSTMTPHDYRIKALCDYCRSYQLTNDATTLSYCIMISVDLGKVM